MKRIILRGMVHAGGARFYSRRLEQFNGFMVKVTLCDDGSAVAQVGAELIPLSPLAVEA